MGVRLERAVERPQEEAVFVDVIDPDDGETIAGAFYVADDRASVEALVGALLVTLGVVPADAPLEPGWSAPWPHPPDDATRDRARARAATRRAARSRRPRCGR